MRLYWRLHDPLFEGLGLAASGFQGVVVGIWVGMVQIQIFGHTPPLVGDADVVVISGGIVVMVETQNLASLLAAA